ncbi:MAG: redoxin domain-containing protein [Cytophagales bacterium]|nr:redoxin domain-containing protein [Armatimonadota bacterium]
MRKTISWRCERFARGAFPLLLVRLQERGPRTLLLLAPLVILVLSGAGRPAPPAPRATALLFLSTRCPISNRYAPRIAALHRVFAKRGVRFVGVYSEGDVTATDVSRHARTFHLPFETLLDKPGVRARRYGATLTPEVVVLDPSGRVRYQGRIDDSSDASRVRSRDLASALEAILSGRAIKIARTRAVGCAIQAVFAKPSPAAPSITYRDIAPILNRNCVSCHRTGQIGPMPLTTFQNAAAWAEQIKRVTRSRAMPPWRAKSNGEFHDERRLATSEIALLSAWANAGAPEGDPKQTPDLPSFPPGPWSLGRPDVEFEMPLAYTVAREGRDLYRCFVIPTRLATDQWIAGIAFAPGNTAVVHHASVFVDTSGAARRLDATDSAPGYTNPTPGNGPGFPAPHGALGGWTPGHSPMRLPPGVALNLPKGADLVLEVHYHPTGKPETDRTRFGLYFATGPIEKRLRMGDVSNITFQIPPGDPRYTATATAVLPFDITVLSVTPHLHNLGRAMTVTATLPNGAPQPIVEVPDWDFRWQPSYRYKTPLKLPRGTRIDLSARFDNTEANPDQPSHPPRLVRWGESTSDEMCTCFFAYTLDSEHLAGETVVVPSAESR